MHGFDIFFLPLFTNFWSILESTYKVLKQRHTLLPAALTRKKHSEYSKNEEALSQLFYMLKPILACFDKDPRLEVPLSLGNSSQNKYVLFLFQGLLLI